MKRLFKFSLSNVELRSGLFLLVVNLFLFSNSHGQMPVVNHPQPPGYTALETREKHDMKVDNNDNIWMGFRFIGLGKYDGSTWTIYDSLNNGLPCNEIFAIDVSDPADIWLGTRLGASRFNGTTFTNYDSLNSGLPVSKINAILKNGSIVWMGTNQGVIQFDGTNFSIFNTVNSGLLNDTVTALKISGNGSLFVGTIRGVSVYQNSTWASYSNSNSIIPNYPVHEIETDASNNAWISTAGIFVITPTGQIHSFLADLQMEEIPMQLPTKGGIAKDDMGRIYFRVNVLGGYLFRFDGLNYTKFQMPQFISGIGALGNKLIMDSNYVLWFSPKRDNSNSSNFYSFDFSSYLPLQNNLSFSFENYKHLEINNVKALMLNRGDMHWDTNNPKYEVPKGSGNHSVYASAFWVGGLDPGGNIHLAAQTYRQTGFDFWPGPIDGISLPFDTVSCAHFNRIWKLSKWQIEQFKQKYADGSVTNGTYSIPEDILLWPARGNNFVTDDKAPFVDFNNDNNYNPFDGDYPLIKGDQMLFWIFNDSLSSHTISVGPKVGCEVHVSAYAYNCNNIADSNSVLNHTTLYNFQVLNRSAIDYNNMYIGLWVDNDLGNYNDDYIGCDSVLSAGFVYNGTNSDLSYGMNPPMQNVVVLRGTLADANDGIDNNLNGIIDEPGERTTMNHFHTYYGIGIYENPQSDQDHYNYMRSLWLDGSPATYGGWGSGGTTPTNFMYSGVPYGTGWTEASVGNLIGDRLFLISSGPVSFQAGSRITMDFAYVFTRDSLNPNGLTTSVARNVADIQRVKYWFENDNFPSCEVYTVGIGEQIMASTGFTINPNPATEVIYLKHSYPRNTVLYYQILDLTGRLIRRNQYSGSDINVSELKPGFYFLTLSDGYSRSSGKFIKR